MQTKIVNTILMAAIALSFVLAAYLIDKHVFGGAESRAEVIFLDVGQGDATLVQKGRMQILVDGGDGQEILNRLGEEMPFTDRSIDLVVVTHPDEDHMGGLIKVLENYRVDMIMETGITCEKDICEKWEDLIDRGNIPVTRAKMGENVRYGEAIDIWVLYPFTDVSGKEYKETNESSIVLKADIEGREFLFTGDTEDETEKEMIRSNLDLDADVLKVSHHGSKNSTSAAFLQEITPEEAVISVGENSYGHPTEEALNRLKNMGVDILRTDEKGSIRF